MNKNRWMLVTVATLLLAACNEGFQGQQLQDSSGGDEIVGGQEIDRGDVRGFYVAKLEVNLGDDTFYCTATHVTDTILITAAHCLRRWTI